MARSLKIIGGYVLVGVRMSYLTGYAKSDPFALRADKSAMPARRNWRQRRLRKPTRRTVADGDGLVEAEAACGLGTGILVKGNFR
jgi:hypothetical protein